MYGERVEAVIIALFLPCDKALATFILFPSGRESFISCAQSMSTSSCFVNLAIEWSFVGADMFSPLIFWESILMVFAGLGVW